MGHLANAKSEDNRWKFQIGIALVIYILFQFVLPPFSPITKGGMGVAGIFIATIYLWIAVGTGWTSLLAIGMLATTGVCSASDVFKNSWGNVMVPFLIGCFILNTAMTETGLTRRIALWFITRKWLKNKPWGILFMYLLSIFCIGLVSTSSPIVVMYMAFAEEIFTSVGYKKGDKFTQAVILFTAMVAQMAVATTPISHALIPMIIGYIATDFKISISIAQYSMIFIPVGILLLLGFWLVFRFIVKPDVSKLSNLDIDALRSSLPPISKAEKIVAAVYVFLITFWLCPDLIKYIPGLHQVGVWMGTMGQAVPVLIAIGVLASVRLKGKPVLDVLSASAKVQWGTVYMMAALMGLAFVLDLDSCGISKWITVSTGPVMSGLSYKAFIAVAVIWVLLQTSFMSDTVSAMMYSVIVPMSVLIPGANPIAVGLLIAAASNIGFITPSACPVCSMVVGSGWVDAKFLVKYGWIATPLTFLALYYVAYPLACKIFPM